jgi:hypothetical protein
MTFFIEAQAGSDIPFDRVLLPRPTGRGWWSRRSSGGAFRSAGWQAVGSILRPWDPPECVGGAADGAGRRKVPACPTGQQRPNCRWRGLVGCV